MKGNFLIPIAIVIAGIIVALALFADRDKDVQLPPPPEKLNIEVSENDHILGNPDADFIIIEYSDLECPFCKNFHTVMHQIIDDFAKDGRVAWVYRHFPLTQIHPKAQQEAEATECVAELAGEDAWWAYTDKIFEETESNNSLDLSLLPEFAEEIGVNREAFESCLSSNRHRQVVQDQYNDGLNNGVQGTPNLFLLVKGQDPVFIDRGLTYSDLRAVIEQTLLTL